MMPWEKMGIAFIAGIPDLGIKMEFNTILENLKIHNNGRPWREFKQIVEDKSKRLQEIEFVTRQKFGTKSESEIPKSSTGKPEVNIVIEGGILVQKTAESGEIYYQFQPEGKSRKTSDGRDMLCYQCGKYGHI